MDWFERITGFSETTYAQTKARLSVADGKLISSANGRTFGIGKLELLTLRELRKLAIEVHTNEKVIEVTPDAVKMASGKVIASTITVWAAGVKAADFLKDLVSAARDSGGET